MYKLKKFQFSLLALLVCFVYFFSLGSVSAQDLTGQYFGGGATLKAKSSEDISVLSCS